MWCVVVLAGNLRRLYAHFGAKNPAVAAFAVDALVKSKVVNKTPKSAGGGVVV
jgi:hypothetical protein